MIHIWEQKLTDYFNTNLILDREADKIRKELHSQVSQQKLFEAVDLDSNGFLTIKEFGLAINKSNKKFKWDSLRRMIKQYDKYGEFSLNTEDFGKFCQFNGQTKDNTEESDKEVNETNFALFIDLVLKEIEISKTLSEMADEIKTTKEFITYEAFRSIAGFDKYITEDNLNAYLTHKGIEVKDKGELSKIIYRYDKNMDGFFGYNEFKDIFSPYSIDDTNAVYLPIREKKTIIRSSSAMSFSPMMKKSSMVNNNNTFSQNSNANTNYMSKMSSKIGGLVYDYSFDEKISDPNDDSTISKQKPMKNSDTNNNLSPKLNPFKKFLINNTMSVTKKYKYDNFPLELKANYSNSNYENPSSNSMLNNSFINMSISQNTNRAYPNLLKRIKEKQLLFQSQSQSQLQSQSQSRSQSYLQQSPSQDNKKENIAKSNYYQMQNHNSSSRLNDYMNNTRCINENKQYLIQYLNEVIIQEFICESAKEELSSNYHIDTRDVFSFFDYSHTEKISLSDFKESLKKISIIITNKELELLFYRYDNDNDCYLNYNEFSDMILPKKRKQEIKFSRQMSARQYNHIPLNSIPLLSNLFYALVSCVKACDYKIKEIALNDNFSNVECYDLLKSKELHTISKEDLHQFYVDNHIQVSQLEIDLLMDYFDKDKDGQISFNEFAKECSPNEIEDIQ